MKKENVKPEHSNSTGVFSRSQKSRKKEEYRPTESRATRKPRMQKKSNVNSNKNPNLLPVINK